MTLRASCLLLTSILVVGPTQAASLPPFRSQKLSPFRRAAPKPSEMDHGLLKATKALIDLLEDSAKGLEEMIKELEARKADPQGIARLRKTLADFRAELRDCYELRDKLRKRIDK